jgi:hypothetical protein
MKDINICKTNYSHCFNDLDLTLKIQKIKYISHSLLFLGIIFLTFYIQSCRSCYATQHLCQRSFYKIFVKFRNNKTNVLKIVLVIVKKMKINHSFPINSLLKISFPHFLENYFSEVKIKKSKTITNHF